MGIFSFLKSAGSKLFKKEDEVKAKSTVDPDAHKQLQIKALQQIIHKEGLQIDDMVLDLDGSSITVKGHCPNQAEREKVILALGNVEGIDCVDDQIEVPTPEPEAVFYTVEKGDTLSKIAKAHYGNAMKYPVIFEANKPLLKDPDKIYPGQVLRIPALES